VAACYSKHNLLGSVELIRVRRGYSLPPPWHFNWLKRIPRRGCDEPRLSGWSKCSTQRIKQELRAWPGISGQSVFVHAFFVFPEHVQETLNSHRGTNHCRNCDGCFKSAGANASPDAPSDKHYCPYSHCFYPLSFRYTYPIVGQTGVKVKITKVLVPECKGSSRIRNRDD
jgi:hypothetical protein